MRMQWQLGRELWEHGLRLVGKNVLPEKPVPHSSLSSSLIQDGDEITRLEVQGRSDISAIKNDAANG